MQYANVSLLQKLLPVLDNFEMALAAVESVKEDKLASLKSGVAMIQHQLRSVLIETGLEEIDATGKPFDPALHEAVSQQESREVKDGNVLQQIRKGYRLKDRLLRPAAVVVAKAPLELPRKAKLPERGVQGITHQSHSNFKLSSRWPNVIVTKFWKSPAKRKLRSSRNPTVDWP